MKCSMWGRHTKRWERGWRRGKCLMHKPIRALAWPLAATFTRRMRKLYNNNRQQNGSEANEKMAITAPSHTHTLEHTQAHTSRHPRTHLQMGDKHSHCHTYCPLFSHICMAISGNGDDNDEGRAGRGRRLVAIILGQPSAISFSQRYCHFA